MSKKVSIGNLTIGGGEKVAVQSMATFKTCTEEAVRQAAELENAGCDILRFSVLDEKDAAAFRELKKAVRMPLVADIHFDHRLAIKAIDGGADKIRINPGNIGGEQCVKAVAEAAKYNGVPIRVGSNTGSIDKEFLTRYGKNEISLAESALKQVAILEKYGVNDIVISVKASSVPLTVKAYEYIAKKTDYPLHLGVTEAGTEYGGVIKNSAALGALLLKGIGDTIRISLSAPPIREVTAAKTLLAALELTTTANLVACPTCGRCEWDCMDFAAKTEKYLSTVSKPIKVAVMGCVVNGPGEAADADVGVAGAKGGCVIFSHGKILKTVKREDLEREFFAEIDKCTR
ncbi:MAG: flavodoxin-dependent (E)-4-hydroxy-3-methylbut-2-enyl-diphosphate synthase [Clostridia bacterium]|nr:flavodoxin-dependent (E)-4-hydroxy-3-methylbut-2-enyl-diphosphate synthase [Clostridia bacterium]